MNAPNWSDMESANRAEMLTYFGVSSLAQSHISDKLAWVITGVESNDYNGVARCRVAENEVEEVITDTLRRFTDSKLPFIWYTDSSSQPADLTQRLEAHGCKRFTEGVCMGADLHALKDTWPGVANLTVENVNDEAGLADWLNVWMTLDDGIREPRERLYASLGFTKDAPLRHYLARLEGRAVAVSQVFLGREAAGLYCVTTLPELRRRGIGRAVVLAALNDAKAAGYRWSVLGPTVESVQMYEQLGFKLYPSNAPEYYLPPEWDK
jgi:ribosomal protein S18 acetylase RimI-like enzyme